MNIAITKEMFEHMVVEKYMDRKGIKDIDMLKRKTLDDLNSHADIDFENILDNEEKMLLEKENNKARIEIKLRKLLNKTSFSMDFDIRS